MNTARERPSYSSVSKVFFLLGTLIIPLVLFFSSGMVFAQTSGSTQGTPASDTSADTLCPQPDATHKYLDPMDGKTVWEKTPTGAVEVINLSYQICSQTTDGFKISGTCEGPKRCHAYLCTDLSGKAFTCSSVKFTIASGGMVSAEPTQTMDQMLLNPTPLSEQDVTLQPLPKNTADEAIKVTTPMNPYIESTKPVPMSSDSMSQWIAQSNWSLSNSMSDAEKSFNTQYGYTLSANPTPVVGQDMTTTVHDTSGASMAYLNLTPAVSNTIDQLAPATPMTVVTPPQYVAPPTAQGVSTFSQFTSEFPESQNVVDLTAPKQNLSVIQSITQNISNFFSHIF